MSDAAGQAFFLVAFIALLVAVAVIVVRRRGLPGEPIGAPVEREEPRPDPEIGSATTAIGVVTAEAGWCVVCGVARASECWPGFGESSIDAAWTTLGHRQLQQSGALYTVRDVGRESLCATHKRVAVRTLEAKLGEVVRRRGEFNALVERELAECETTLLATMQLDQRRTVDAMRAVAAAVDRPAPQLSRGTMTLITTRSEEE